MDQILSLIFGLFNRGNYVSGVSSKICKVFQHYYFMVNLQRISAVTLSITNMEQTCKFYSKVPGFNLVYGGSSYDIFSTFQIGYTLPMVYVNFELIGCKSACSWGTKSKTERGRLIFHIDDVNELFSYFQNNKSIAENIVLETKPKDAPWGDCYFQLWVLNDIDFPSHNQ